MDKRLAELENEIESQQRNVSFDTKNIQLRLLLINI